MILKPSDRRSASCRLRIAALLGMTFAGTYTPVASAQVGQSAMPATGGLVNRAMAGLGDFGKDGPGWLYYGINAADRGLGYRGSYMTLGGFFPTVEDDLGGLWSADLRGHLSEYGGFFSNVGAVRKQFIGGTLLGVGVYWDYDGDQNQYSDTVIPVGLGNTSTFAGGFSYNQVGISGEWLTDFGNLRSNGYIPLGSTGQLVGPFLGNSLLCVNGINAALGGADLEVGAYIPGLSDWAGMVSVGGYALGNTLYEFPNGEAAVPWFGGVYTRLDMTFRDNWDFSLQANNDSYFDWTGFARLTYRMGASRRRNVPDQMEQPMMRNEHIVRAHQVPVVATNPVTGAAWQVFHVDNTAAAGGNGSAEMPFNSIEAAVTRPVNDPYDIVYLSRGTSSATAPYVTPVSGFTFGAANQYLIGEGSTIAIPTESCGERQFFVGSNTTAYPFLSNPVGPAIVMDQADVQVNHVGIVNSPIGISDGNGIAAPAGAIIEDVTIAGSDAASQRGIVIEKSTGTFAINNVRLSNLTNDGLVLSAANGRVALTSSTFAGITGTAIRVSGSAAQATVANTSIADTNGIAVAATGIGSAISLTSGTIAATTGDAVVASGAGAEVELTAMRIAGTSGSGLSATGSGAVISATSTTITNVGEAAPAIALLGAGSAVTIIDTLVDRVGGNGVLLDAADSVFTMTGASRLRNVAGDGIRIADADAFAIVSGRSIISDIEGSGVSSQGGSLQIVDSTIQSVDGDGIFAEEARGTTGGGMTRGIWVQGATIRNVDGTGIFVTNSDLRVERADPTNLGSRGTTIDGTGLIGIQALLAAGPSGTMSVLVDAARISGVNTGIVVAADADPGAPGADPTNIINFTASNNQISTDATGTGITISAVFDTDLEPPLPGTATSRVRADIQRNQIGGGGGTTPILLTTVGGPTQDDLGALGFAYANPSQKPIWVKAGGQTALQNLNNGAAVTEVPAPEGVIFTSVNYNSAIVVPLPPSAP